MKQIGLEPPFPLTETPEQEYCPAWSPDGMFIAFLRKLSDKEVALILMPQRGGRERVLVKLNVSIPSWLGLYGPSLAWTPDSKWIVAPELEAGNKLWSLHLVSVATGEKKRLTNPPQYAERGEAYRDTSPAFSPDGRTLVFSRMPPGWITNLWLLRLAEGYGPLGEPERLASANPHNIGAAWTPDGREIVFSSSPKAGYAPSDCGLWRVTASASAAPSRLAFAQDNARAPAISRLGNRLAYSVERTDTNIWRVDLQGPDRKPGVPFKFISSTRQEINPGFSPDGKRVAFASERSGAREIWLCDGDGLNPVSLSCAGVRMKWSPDSQSIVFDNKPMGHIPEEKRGVYVVSANGGVPRLLTTEGDWPSWSRDGKSIYFRSGRSGTEQIWKMPAGGGQATQISNDKEGVDYPQPSVDGKFIYYGKGWPGPSSVWRLPVEGGEATKVLDGIVHPEGVWTVGPEGIYFFVRPDEKGYSDLCFYDFATGKIRKILTVERPLTWYIDVSSDGRTILYTQVDEAGSDLMLVENFR